MPYTLIFLPNARRKIAPYEDVKCYEHGEVY